jgi:type VI secretion system protein ImpK
MQTDWGKGVTTGVEWSQNGLAVAFGEDRQGGDGVYRVIRQAMRHPQENLDLIEVIQNILDLGFKGRYRFEARGQDTLEAIREQVHDAVVTSGWSVPSPSVQRARVASPAPLPRWPVDPWVRPAPTRNTRLWIAIGLLSVALLGACAYVVHERLTRESRLQQLTPPMDVLARNLDSLLKSEIAAGSVSLEGNVAHTALTLRFNDMFPPGQATVNAWVGPLIATAGREIAKAPGRVRVTGYTDSLPVSKSQSASNKTLSEDRATQVMQILSAAGVPAERLETAGKGKADPIAGNETPQGRARNRRVEIMVSE